MYYITHHEGAVVGAPAAVGAVRSARAAGAAVGAADGVGERAAPPQQLGPSGVAGRLRGEAVRLPLHGGGRNHLSTTFPILLDTRTSLQGVVRVRLFVARAERCLS